MPDAYVPGCRFKDGKLYLFTADTVSVICGWPAAEAVCRRAGRPWRAFLPRQRLVLPFRRPRSKPASRQLTLFADEVAPVPRRRVGERRRSFDAFRFSLPRSIAHRLEPFLCNQFPVLRALQTVEGFADLLEANRPLAYCVANAPSLGCSSPLPAGLLQRKQRDVLAWIGFPASAAAVRTLRRVYPESLSPHHLAGLRQALADPARQQCLGHVPRVNAGIIELLADESTRSLATPALFEEVATIAAEKYRPHTAERIRSAVYLHLALFEPRRPPDYRFRSVAQVETVHAELRDEFERRGLWKKRYRRFPHPPVPGTANIVPLRQAEELVEEGDSQRNCVAGYAPEVVAGTVYIYRVLGPERATLSIARNRGFGWRLDELKAARNRPVRPETLATVEDWLAGQAI